MKERGGRSSKQQHEANGVLRMSKAKFVGIEHKASWDKEELLDVLHWIRQGIALVCGVLWGCIPLVGSLWIVLFLALSSGAIYGYYKFVLKVEEEDFGGHTNLLQEGLFTSVMLFLLSWILIYSLLHF